MKYFIEELNVDPKQKDKINQSPLYYTSREGKFKTSEYLISKGVPVNEPDLYAQTPIYYACRDGRLNVVKLLVENGADLNIIDKYGQSALFYAIKEGKADVVDFITGCSNFTKINQADKKGMTPYMFALKNNRNEISELLFNRGANPDTKAEKKSKTKKPAKQEEEKIEEDIQKPQKYVLCRINENGEKIACSVEEMEIFKKMYPEVFQKMTSQDELNKLEESAPEE
jgi:ankyrin repeat protein